MKRTVKYISGLVWLGVVIFYYLKYHTYYQYDLPGILHWWPLWIWPLIAYLIFLAWTWASEKQIVQVKLSLIRVLTAFFLGMLFVGVTSSIRTNPTIFLGPTTIITKDGKTIVEPTEDQLSQAAYRFDYATTIEDTFGLYEKVPQEISKNLVRANVLQTVIGLSWTILRVYGITLFLILYAWLIGSAMHSLLRRKEKDKDDQDFERGALETVFGLGMVSILLFIVAAIGQFNLPAIFTILFLALAPFYKHVFSKLKHLWKWENNFEFKATDFTLPLLIIIFLIFGVHMFDNLSALPRGWDGMNRYIVIAKDLAQGGHLLERGAMYAWELILGFGYLMGVKISLAWTSFPGVMTFILMWILARKFSSKTGALLAIATIAIMPMMSFHLSDENKVDVAHWLFGTAAIISMLRAMSFEGTMKVKDNNYLFIAGLLTGFAFTIKLTGSILALSMLGMFGFIEGGIIGLISALLIAIGLLASSGGIGLGSEFQTTDATSHIITIIGISSGIFLTLLGLISKKIKTASFKMLVILLLFLLLPIIPWLAKNALETKSLSPSNLINGANAIPVIDFQTTPGICKGTGFFEEYDRYIGYNKNFILRMIEVPWHTTMNDTGAIGAYVDMGFAFLGFILLFFLFYKPDKKKNFLLGFACLYFVFWLFKANGVNWYGFPFFSLMCVALAYTFTSMEKDKIGKIVLLIVIGSWILVGFDARLSNYSKPGLILENEGLISADDLRESIFPYSDELSNILTNNEGYVYKIGTPLGYFIPDFVERSYDDQLLDTFDCIYKSNGENFEATRRKLREIGFRFMLYDSYTSTVGIDPEGTLKNKISNFENFAKEQLVVVIFDDKRGHHLLYIPSDEEWQIKNGNKPDEKTDSTH